MFVFAPLMVAVKAMSVPLELSVFSVRSCATLLLVISVPPPFSTVSLKKSVMTAFWATLVAPSGGTNVTVGEITSAMVKVALGGDPETGLPAAS